MAGALDSVAASASDTGTLAGRLDAVRSRIAAACARAGRDPESVMLVAVSKTHPPETLLEAIACGQLHFGENRVEEAAGKIAAVNAGAAQPVTWHMVGHVQSRKAREAVALFDWIHSLDNVRLAERYARLAAERPIRLLLEVNISGEISKYGLAAHGWERDRHIRESLWADIRHMIEQPGLKISGLMTMAPIADDPEQVRPVFAGLRRLRDALASDFPASAWDVLSMGMTDDYEVAIEEGATLVRIGRAIFGPRIMP